MLDQDEAIWLAEVLLEAVAHLEDAPGVTVEAEGNANQWLQVLFDNDEEGILGGFTLNFPYRTFSVDPLAALTKAGIKLPPNTRTVEWEDGGFATIWIRSDAPVVALAHLIGDILQNIVGAAPGTVLAAQIEYGY